MITVSVCMIVKNEEAILPRCLDSLHGIADEIIVVDTGSTDGTKSAAKRYTDQVFDFEWHGDFSEARNFAFSKAAMEYIYSADADEWIDPANREKFILLKQTLASETDIVEMQYDNQLRFNTTYNFNRESRPKLFKRLRSFHWIDPVHETVDLKVHVMESDIVITHIPQNLHAKRDFSIFLTRVKKSRLDSRLHRMYAKELFIAGTDSDFLDAYPYFEGTLHDESFSAEDIRVSQCVAARGAHLRKDDLAFFKTALKNGIGNAPSAEVCCELGDYFQEKKDYEEAATWYYTAAFGAQSELNIHYSGDIPLKRLSDCYQAMRMPLEANKYRAQADTWKVPE